MLNKYLMKRSYLALGNLSFSLVCLVMFMFVGMSSVSAQCPLACNGQVNVSLDENCEAIITPDMVIEDYDPACPYVVEITDADGNVIGDRVDGSHVGMLLTVSVYVGNNSCWGNLLVEDKLAPTFTCDGDITVACNSDYNGIPDPGLVDNCDPNPILYILSDETEVQDCGSPWAAIRTLQFVSEDASGNVSDPCVQVVYYERTDLANVEPPLNADGFQSAFLSCSDTSWDTNGNGYPDPEETGYPTIDGEPIFTGAGFCSLNIVYEDQILPLCGGAYKVLRTWTVFDWCIPSNSGTNPLVFIQVIKVEDDAGPIVTCPADFTVDAADSECNADLLLPALQYYDVCATSGTSYSVDFSGSVAGAAIAFNPGSGLYLLSNLPIGTHTIVYTADDGCGNTTSCEVDITVEDNTPPIPVCDEHTVVSLTTTGTTDVPATVFDDGSYDNCNDVFFKVRRMNFTSCDFNYGTYDDVATFCCDDVDLGDIQVILRVFDVDPGPGFVFNSRMEPGGDLYGHYNDCMVLVDVQDKIAPVLVAPPNITIDCTVDVDLSDLEVVNSSVYGSPTVSDNCDPTITVTAGGSADDCGTGVYFRTFTAADGNGSTTATQTITVTNNNPFNGNSIVWPGNYDVGCMDGTDPEDLPSGFDAPSFNQVSCSLIGVTYEDDFFQYVDGVCAKILRTWSVIDWCQFDQSNPGASGIWTYVQVIKVENNTAPTITEGCTDISICSYDDDCSAAVTEGLNIVAVDDCDGENITYSYAIDAFSDGVFDIFGNGNDANGSYPIGNHIITWTVADQCGNETTCSANFTIADCKKPTPVCISGLSSVVMPSTGEVTIWANDFETGSSFDNCTAHEDLLFSFSSNTSETGMTFTCDDIGTNLVQIWVTDEFGNQDYCETFIIIDDNDSVCNGISNSITVGGTIELMSPNQGISEVDVYLTDNLTGVAYEATTDANGFYSFAGVHHSSDYVINPIRNHDPMNGVSTLDLVAIQKHLLGITPFTEFDKFVAADINLSETVSAIDIVELRKLILGIYVEFPNNESWRFIDPECVPANQTYPGLCQEEINLNTYTVVNQMALDFNGVKVGDLNGSAQLFTSTELEDRSSLTIKTVERDGAIDFVATNDFDNMIGLQFALDVTGININDLSSNLIDLNSSNFHIDNGLMTFSWNDAIATQLSEGDVIFTMNATGKASSLNLVDAALEAELYTVENNDITINAVNLETTSVVDGDFALYGNSPNPFVETTTISFFLPNESDVNIEFYNTAGMKVYELEQYFAKGMNEVDVKVSDLGENLSGIIVYQISTGEFTASRKMTILK